MGTKTVDSAVVGDSLKESAWLSSVRATYAMSDLLATPADGPLVVGIAHSDYTSAEIEGWIESANSWDQGNMVSQEVRQRKIRTVGVFTTAGAADGVTIVLNDGKPITTKCGWMLSTGQTVRFWLYNQGLGSQDAGVLTIQGKANLWPN